MGYLAECARDDHPKRSEAIAYFRELQSGIRQYLQSMRPDIDNREVRKLVGEVDASLGTLSPSK